MLNIIRKVLLFIWQLPQNIVALVMLPFIGKLNLLCVKRDCWVIHASGMEGRGSISLGNFVFIGRLNPATVAHELGHVVDSHLFGPLYLFIIGIPSIVWAGFNIDDLLGRSYYSFYPERRANRHSHVHDVKLDIGTNRYILEFDEGYSLEDIE